MMKQQPLGYPSLTKSYKGAYPFKIGTTSFIYPDDYIPNVKMLGPYIDEVELLLFESQAKDVLPSHEVISELGRLAIELELSYNVHLPTDVSVSDHDPSRQQQAVETIIRVVELVRPLNASALILHVPYCERSYDGKIVDNWRARVYQNLVKVKSAVEKKDIIAVETLDYPFELIEDILLDLDMMICLDLGHLIVYEYDLKEVYSKHSFKTSVLHLHGVENDRDHVTLQRMPEEEFEKVLWILNRFTGVVCIEVFSFENLDTSLRFLESHWTR